MTPAVRGIVTRATVFVATIALAALVAGCGSDGVPTGVESGAFNPPAVAGSIVGDWTVLASAEVGPTSGPVVLAGGRYVLSIPAGAVPVPVVVSISESPAGELEFVIGPAGMVLGAAATLRIDYAGTSLDPDHPDYSGGEPQLWVVDGAGDAVERVDGRDFGWRHSFSASLESFDHLKLVAGHGGTAGWD